MKYIKNFENIDWDNEWDFEEEDVSIPSASVFKGNERFYNFLVKNNILGKFLFNFNQKTQKEWRKKYNIQIKIEDFLYIEKPNEFIQNSFLWVNTIEDEQFWVDIQDKWINEL